MFDPMLGPVTVVPLCRRSMIGGLAGVMVSLMGTRRCSPTQDVRVGERLVFVAFINKYLCVYFNAECQMSGICLKTLPEIPETVDSCKKMLV